MHQKNDRLEQRLLVWTRRYQTARMLKIAAELPLRQDMVTLLRFVRENKVIGTQSTGNMPLKMVRKVTAEFVNPPILDGKMGDRTYRLRSEEDIWSLYFLHVLAEVGGLIDIAPGRRWKLTPNGEKVFEVNSLQQVSLLLSIWWYQVNWIVAFPYSGIGAELPPYFSYQTLEELLSLRQGQKIRIDNFASELIEKTELAWGAPDSSFAGMLLQSAIERMVIGILATFGTVKIEYREEQSGKATISKMHTFTIVPFGRAMLESVAIMRE